MECPYLEKLAGRYCNPTAPTVVQRTRTVKICRSSNYLRCPVYREIQKSEAEKREVVSVPAGY